MKNIVITGADGFIASNLAKKLNHLGYDNLILVDSLEEHSKNHNLDNVECVDAIERDQFIEWLTENSDEVEFIFHLGARTDTSEFNFRVLDSLNLSYSKALWEVCTVKQIPLLYASSAATYGMGENTFSDDHALIKNLKPLNPYGLSKHLFDLFVLEQTQTPPFWCGLKFFNVYGPHEFYKGRMASVVLHAYSQIKKTGKVKLFKSHHPDFKDGQQLRDFIYVDDVVDVCLYFFNNAMQNEQHTTDNGKDKIENAIYNLGTGNARTFKHLVNAIFNALNLPPHIEYIPTPEDIRDKYQYFTEAKIDKLVAAGYDKNFINLEDGVKNYVHFLEMLQSN